MGGRAATGAAPPRRLVELATGGCRRALGARPRDRLHPGRRAPRPRVVNRRADLGGRTREGEQLSASRGGASRRPRRGVCDSDPGGRAGERDGRLRILHQLVRDAEPVGHRASRRIHRPARDVHHAAAHRGSPAKEREREVDDPLLLPRRGDRHRRGRQDHRMEPRGRGAVRLRSRGGHRRGAGEPDHPARAPRRTGAGVGSAAHRGGARGGPDRNRRRRPPWHADSGRAVGRADARGGSACVHHFRPQHPGARRSGASSSSPRRDRRGLRGRGDGEGP